MNMRKLCSIRVAASAILMIASALAIGCGSSPYAKFEAELDAKFEKLIDELESYAEGETTRDAEGVATWYDDGQLMMNDEAVLPTDRAWMVIPEAQDIEEQFSYLSLEFLSQNPDNLDDWGVSLKKKYKDYQSHALAALDKIKERYKSNPDTYSSVLFGPTLGLTSEDRLYFRQGQTGYLIDEIIDIDIDAWIVAVKEQMAELQ